MVSYLYVLNSFFFLMKKINLKLQPENLTVKMNDYKFSFFEKKIQFKILNKLDFFFSNFFSCSNLEWKIVKRRKIEGVVFFSFLPSVFYYLFVFFCGWSRVLIAATSAATKVIQVIIFYDGTMRNRRSSSCKWEWWPPMSKNCDFRGVTFTRRYVKRHKKNVWMSFWLTPKHKKCYLDFRGTLVKIQ